MALIKCPECGHEISEHAHMCVSCGCPMEKIKEILKEEQQTGTKPLVPKCNYFSKSEVYESLSKKEKTLIDEICNFILDNTLLMKSDHPKNFGFRKKGHKKMVVTFKRNKGSIYLQFRVQSKLLSKTKYKVTIQNLNSIKDSLMVVFPLKNNQNRTISNKQKPDPFIMTRNELEIKTIKTFEDCLRTKIPTLLTGNDLYKYSFRYKTGTETISLCWFANGDNDVLAFKYYLNPLKREKQKICYPSVKDVNSIVNIIYKIYLNVAPSKNENIVHEYRDEKFEIEKDNLTVKEPILYDLIIDAIKEKPLHCSKEFEKLCNDIRNLVYSEIKQKGIEQKYFASEEEFEKYKFSYRFIPNFFGYTFSLRNLTKNDAKIFFSFYKAISLINIIKKYENIYNKIIIHDYASVLHDFQEMIIKNGETNYSTAQGLTSSFNLVPITVLDNCLENLKKFETV